MRDWPSQWSPSAVALSVLPTSVAPCSITFWVLVPPNVAAMVAVPIAVLRRPQASSSRLQIGLLKSVVPAHSIANVDSASTTPEMVVSGASVPREISRWYCSWLKISDGSFGCSFAFAATNSDASETVTPGWVSADRNSCLRRVLDMVQGLRGSGRNGGIVDVVAELDPHVDLGERDGEPVVLVRDLGALDVGVEGVCVPGERAAPVVGAQRALGVIGEAADVARPLAGVVLLHHQRDRELQVALDLIYGPVLLRAAHVLDDGAGQLLADEGVPAHLVHALDRRVEGRAGDDRRQRGEDVRHDSVLDGLVRRHGLQHLLDAGGHAPGLRAELLELGLGQEADLDRVGVDVAQGGVVQRAHVRGRGPGALEDLALPAVGAAPAEVQAA